MKNKILSLTAIILLVIPLTQANSESAPSCENQNFLVSAYYSPLPGQKMYMRGSYDKDIILNGRGTNGADGTEVFTGMFAAPKNYAFGTKIYIPSLGYGTVHDRGGAIVARSNYDRIDVWMGKGETGLKRALNWGMRFVQGKKCKDDGTIVNNIDMSSISTVLPSSVENRLISKTNALKNTVYKTPVYKTYYKPVPQYNYEYVFIPGALGEGDQGEDVLTLQMIMQNLGYYKHNILTGVFDFSTIEAVFQFQRENAVITGSNDLGAGYFGKKTKKALEVYLSGLHKQINSVNLTKQGEILESTVANKPTQIVSAQNNLKNLPASKAEIFAYNESMSVKTLQVALRGGNSMQDNTTSIVAGSTGNGEAMTMSQILP